MDSYERVLREILERNTEQQALHLAAYLTHQHCQRFPNRAEEYWQRHLETVTQVLNEREESDKLRVFETLFTKLLDTLGWLSDIGHQYRL